MSDGVSPMFRRYDPVGDKAVAKEVEWYAKTWKPKAGVDYSGVCAYAKQQYDDALASFSDVDKKSEWCFGLCAAIAGAVIAFGDKTGIEIQLFFPGLVFFVFAMGVCLRIRLPIRRATPMSIRSLIDVTENTDAYDARLAASYHCAVESLRFAIGWKSAHLKATAILITLGMLCLVVSILFT